MGTPHERSIGARMERKAIRAFLRRELKLMGGGETDYSTGQFDAIKSTLGWVLGRQHRYDQRSGGLGRK